MTEWIMWLMAIGAVIGGVDAIVGDRLGLGEPFKRAFLVMGQTALPMAGIICIEPLLAALLSKTVAPLYAALGLDPALLGGLLALDMGGYPLAVSLAKAPLMADYSGILLASTLGCTLTFTIPTGLSLVSDDDRGAFARGISLGMLTLPLAMLAGGAACGLSLPQLLWQSLPVDLLVILLLLGLAKKPKLVDKAFAILAGVIRILAIIGVILGATRYLTKLPFLSFVTPIEDALAVVSGIGVTLLGSLPIAALLRRLLARPLIALGRRVGLNDASIMGLLVSVVSVTPALLLIRDMDRRGKVVNVAFMVCAASLFAAHLGFTVVSRAALAPALMICKLGGGLLAIGVAWLATRPMRAEP